MRSLLRALHYVRPYWPLQAGALVCALAVTAAQFVMPWMNKVLIDEVMFPKYLPASVRLATLYRLAAVAAAALLAGNALSLLRTYLFARAGEFGARDLRRDLFRHLHALPMSFYDRRRIGGIMSVVQNDVEALQGLYSSTLVDLVTSALMALIASAVLVWRNSTLAMIGLPVPVLFAAALALFGSRLRRSGRQVREDTGAVQEVLQESIAGAREVKVFDRAASELARYLDRVARLVRSRIRQAVLSSANGTLAGIIAMGGMLTVLVLGTRLAVRGAMSPGDVMMFLSVLGMLFGPASTFVSMYAGIAIAVGAADRIFEFVDAETEHDPPTPVHLDTDEGRVRFVNVCFAYDREGPEILHDINLEVEPGEMIALVGPSGAGKTTLVSLLPRLYDVTSGAIYLDGHDIRTIRLADLRRRIAIVPQEPFLFGTSVAENIRFGREDATDDEVVAAARAANAHEFIVALPQGYETQVGERGARLSTGQKQRIAIARAILRDPRILILDEATSAQDSESERQVQEAIARLLRNRTSFVIAHRLSTIQRADRIVVIENGTIAEIGPHADLLRSGGTYARLHAIQFGDAFLKDTAEVTSPN